MHGKHHFIGLHQKRFQSLFDFRRGEAEIDAPALDPMIDLTVVAHQDFVVDVGVLCLEGLDDGRKPDSGDACERCDAHHAPGQAGKGRRSRLHVVFGKHQTLNERVKRFSFRGQYRPALHA